MKGVKVSVFGRLLSLLITVFAVNASASALDLAPGARGAELATTIDATDPMIATSAEIDRALASFVSQNKDIASLYSADEFRTPGAKKFLEKAKVDSPEMIVKINAAKKSLDAIQRRTRNVISLQGVAVGPNQFPRIYNLARRAAAALELSDNFHIFIYQSPTFNAFTYSYDPNDYDVVIHSGAIEALDDEALLALLGHEMGHVKDQALISGLILAASFENRNRDTAASTHQAFYDKIFGEMPAGLRNQLALAATGLVARNEVGTVFESESQVNEFQRNCELTADRAAVLVTGSTTAPLKLLSALAYGSKALSPEFNQDELIKQIRTVLASTDNPEDLAYLVLNQDSHPFNVLRLIEVTDFGASATYRTLRDRMNEDSFAKELDIFSRIVTNAALLTAKYKKYLDEQADSDETLVRLKTKDTYTNQINRLSRGFSDLGVIILGQIAASPLNAESDPLFDEFMAKAKSDRNDILKSLLGPALSDLLKKRAESSTHSSEKALINAKLDRVQKLLEVQ